MAEVVNGVGEILKRLISMASQEIGLVWNVKEELEKLVRTLTAIQALLQDAEKQQEDKESVRLFLRRLKDVAYAAEDVLDEFGYQTTRLQVTNKVSKFCLLSISPVFKLKMAHKIQNISKVLDEIRRDMNSFNFVRAPIPTSALQNRNTIETFSFVDKSEVVGRDNDKSKIVSMLTSSDHQDTLSVLPIVGMGGLGKTTLAKLVYNDSPVDKYFDKRIWVHVSKDFDIKKVLKDIVESVTKRTCQFSSTDVIQQTLRDELSDKRFLLVLDDIWNDDSEQWDMLKSSLKIGARGSKIIATTRSNGIASMMGTLPTHHLKRLSEEKCWSILKNKAFGNGGAEETPNMVAIGKKIVKKCGGLPLAAKALGGLMHIKKDEQEWISMRDSEIWDLPMDRDGILPALKLSYDHIPSPLKQCILYCSIIPKGIYIFKNGLIQQWMALGFLQPSVGGRPMEDIGDDYVNYLLWNSFFQDAEKDSLGNIVMFKMHDLVSDLAHSLSRLDNAIVVAEDFKNSSDVFHLTLLIDGDMKKLQECLSKLRKLRSLLVRCIGPRISICNHILNILFKKLEHLRVLDLSFCGIKELPSSIKKLKHLRCLHLRNNPIEALPASITSLYNLQTLDLLNCPIKELPQDMRKLVNLRQLLINRLDKTYLSQMPVEIGRLTCLNYLPMFVVGHKKGQSTKELEHLDLRGGLWINNLENVRSRGEAEEANLMGKEKLLALHLSWGSHVLGGDNSHLLGNDKKKTIVNEDDILEGLRPHPNLKHLYMENFGGENFPRWMMSGCESFLRNLVELFLDNCERLENVPPLGQQPSLKILGLKGMRRVKSLGNEFYHENGSNNQSAITTTFPSLEELSLDQMSSLEEWVEVQSSSPSFPRLERIFVQDCPKLMIIPSQFPSLKGLGITKSNGVLLRLVVEVPSLTDLDIIEVPELKILPKGLLHKNIQHLYIEKCPNLEAIIMPSEEDVQVLPSSLELLAVKECSSLTSLPDLRGLQSIRNFWFRDNGNFTRLPEGLHTLDTLEFLSIGGLSSELESFPDLDPLQHLPFLRILHIAGWSKLTSLPEQLRHLTQIECLGVHKFHSVTALPEWLGNLSSLRWLILEECNNLMYLPKEEEGLRCFTALQELTIRSCPLLKQRCTKGKGEEWPKIKDIRFIEIDYQYV